MLHPKSIEALNLKSQETLADSGSDFLYRGAVDAAAWVKTARKHARMSQEALGERLSVTKGNVSHWEAGKHKPSFSQLLDIAMHTGYPLLTHDAVSPPKDIREALRLVALAIASAPPDRHAAIAEGLAGLVRDKGAEFRQRSVLALFEPDDRPLGESGTKSIDRGPPNAVAA